MDLRVNQKDPLECGDSKTRNDYQGRVGTILAKTVGKRLLELRKRSGMKRPELAAASGVGKNTIGKLERQEAENVTLEIMEMLAKALGVTIYNLLDGAPSWADHPSFKEFKRSGLARGASKQELKELTRECSWHSGSASRLRRRRRSSLREGLCMP
jgi:transcriptional regulator with XRE-family HTH domain